MGSIGACAQARDRIGPRCKPRGAAKIIPARSLKAAGGGSNSGRMNRNASAILAGTAVLAAALIGARNGPQAPRSALWYALLRKPAYTPPGRVIGPTWGVLEVLLAATGYRLLHQPATEARTVALGAWAGSLLGLAGFPWLFFRRKRLGSSAAVSAAMLAAVATTTIAARNVDRPASAMSLPVLAWLGFATVLSADLRRRN